MWMHHVNQLMVTNRVVVGVIVGIGQECLGLKIGF